LILIAGDAVVWRQSTRAQESVPPPFHLKLNSQHNWASHKIRILTDNSVT
jgi:hypothetical protein